MPEIVSTVIQLHPVRVVAGEVEHLLLLRSDRVAYGRNVWQVVTGRIEAGETAMQAARRELFEETGQQGEAWAALPEVATFYFEPTDQVMLSPILLCELPPEVEPILSHEHVEFTWLPLAEARELVRYPSQREGMALVEKHVRERIERSGAARGSES